MGAALAALACKTRYALEIMNAMQTFLFSQSSQQSPEAKMTLYKLEILPPLVSASPNHINQPSRP